MESGFHSPIKIKRIKIYSVIPFLKQSLLQVKYDIQTFLFGGGGYLFIPTPLGRSAGKLCWKVLKIS